MRSLDQVGGDREDSAFGVGSGGDSTVTCGYTQSRLGGPERRLGRRLVRPGASPTERSGATYQQGGTDWDRLYGTTMVRRRLASGTPAATPSACSPAPRTAPPGCWARATPCCGRSTPTARPRWIRQFGSEATDWGQGVAATSDGDGLIVGYTQGDLDGPSSGGTDGFIARFDPDGLPRWTRQFGTDGADWPKGVAVGGDADTGHGGVRDRGQHRRRNGARAGR